jgi:hypothetical protein
MVWVTLADPPWRLWQRMRPYAYDPSRYSDTFLVLEPRRLDDPVEREVPRVIRLLWLGDAEMSSQRRAGVDSIQRLNPGIDVQLITDQDLDLILVAEEPLHPAYEYLSFNHRSDYLRGYLLHHHGGGYCDVKPVRHSWAPAFDRLEQSEAWLLGYTEVRFDMVPKWPGRLGRDLVRASTQVLGQCSMIARAHSPLTRELHAEQIARLDHWLEELERHPGGVRGETPGYPVPWLGLFGGITGPLCLKYQERIIHDDTVIVRFKNYM